MDDTGDAGYLQIPGYLPATQNDSESPGTGPRNLILLLRAPGDAGPNLKTWP